MRRWLVTLLVTAWGLRLSIYLSIRNWGKGEDPRYAKWRKATGKRFWIASLFKVFWLQSVFLWVISWVVQVPQTSARPEHLTPFDLIGFFVVMIGILYESVADWQLYRFKKDPENRKKVMDFGLWRYSRHPNYLGSASLGGECS